MCVCVCVCVFVSQRREREGVKVENENFIKLYFTKSDYFMSSNDGLYVIENNQLNW